MNKLVDDSFIFSIPGKFPEAYHKTIDELQRRKEYNESMRYLSIIMQNVMKNERKKRSKFNRKFADYLPNIINTDLETESIDIIISD